MKGAHFALTIMLIVVSLLWISATRIRCADQFYVVEESKMDEARKMMIEQLIAYGIADEKILGAMSKVRRHKFLPTDYTTPDAYGDFPMPIGYGQTISQPFIVAYMTERIALNKGDKVLEIGTGSGYQAAILAELGADVYSIEIVPELASHSILALEAEGYSCKVKCGDGYQGWPEYSPFSVIIVTCAPEEVPQKLIEQLNEGGRMILPLGGRFSQRLVILRKKHGKVEVEEDLPVRFVPMIKK